MQKEVQTKIPVSTTGEEGNFVLKCMIPYVYPRRLLLTHDYSCVMVCTCMPIQPIGEQ